MNGPPPGGPGGPGGHPPYFVFYPNGAFPNPQLLPQFFAGHPQMGMPIQPPQQPPQQGPPPGWQPWAHQSWHNPPYFGG
jgi:hypothetical protein